MVFSAGYARAGPADVGPGAALRARGRSAFGGALGADGALSRLPAAGQAQAVDDLSAVLLRLTGDAALRDRMGRAGHERVAKTFAWPAKAAEFSRLYGVPAGVSP